jgi:hypothetical protein
VPTSRSILTGVRSSAALLLAVVAVGPSVARSGATSSGNGRPDDYFDFGGDGGVDRAASLNPRWSKDDETLCEFTIEDPQVKLLDDHSALIT